MTLGVSVPHRQYEGGFNSMPSTYGTVTIPSSASKATVNCGALNGTDIVHVAQTVTSASQPNSPLFEIQVSNGVNVRQTGANGVFVVGYNGCEQNFTITPNTAPDAGTWTITYDGQTTSALQFDAAAADIQAALEALSNIGASNVLVAGTLATTVVITFVGSMMRVDTPAPTATSSLTASAVAVTLDVTDSTTVLTNAVTFNWMILKA